MKNITLGHSESIRKYGVLNMATIKKRTPDRPVSTGHLSDKLSLIIFYSMKGQFLHNGRSF